MDAESGEEGEREGEREAVAIAASDRTRVYFEYVAAWEMGAWVGGWGVFSEQGRLHYVFK